MSSSALSEHFSWEEVEKSSTAERLGIDNSLPIDLVPVIKKTAVGMELVRSVLGNKGIHINSWYRCLALNKALSSKDTSQHIKGEAVDFVCPEFGTPLEICKTLVEHTGYIAYDKLILEHTWVHISFCGNPSDVPHKQVLSLLANGTYAIGLTDKYGVTYD